MSQAKVTCSTCGLEHYFEPPFIKGRRADDHEIRDFLRKTIRWLFNGFMWSPKAKAYCSKTCAEAEPTPEPSPTAPARREREEDVQTGLGL